MDLVLFSIQTILIILFLIISELSINRPEIISLLIFLFFYYIFLPIKCIMQDQSYILKKIKRNKYELLMIK